MYNEYKNGSKYTLYPVPDEEPIEVNLPPVGWIKDRSGKMKQIGVYRRSKIFADCKWEIDQRWAQYRQWKSEEDKFKKANPDYIHPKLVEFINDCWDYRIGGFWFYNNTEPTYITGHHWFFLSSMNIEGGILPSYRSGDRDFYYFWEYCKWHPSCYGLLFLTMRRQGKSIKAGSIAIDLTTTNANFNTGIQSKTDADAKEFFRKAIVAPYKKLPYFFMVANSNLESSGKLPSSELRFISSKSGDFDDELDSKVDYKPSVEVAYDGSKLGLYIADEVGKPQNVDINSRWDVVQFCLRGFDGGLVGKTIHTTTVEDMGGAADKLMKMWVGSDIHSISEDKQQTSTGMFRFFLPAQYTLKVDDYGNALVEESLRTIMSERKAKEGSAQALASVIRKMPTNIKEAFQSDSTSCAFNPIILQKREDELKWSKGEMLYEVGNLYWKDDKEFGDVGFVANPNGRFKIAMHPHEQIRNGRIERFGMTMPANNAEYCAGIDPYDHKIKLDGHKSEGKLSKGAIVVLKKTSVMYPDDLDEGVACLYLHRTENPEDFYMDAIKCLMYYGCEALIEINRTGFNLWLEKKALENYSAFLPTKSARGITASDKSNSQLAEYTDQYINNYCDKVNFIELIQDWLRFDVSNTTVFDAAMAFGYARMLRKVREERIMNKTAITNINDLFKWYRK